MASTNSLYDYLISYNFTVGGAEAAESKVSAAIDKINSKSGKLSQAEQSVQKLTEVLQGKGISDNKIAGILQDFGKGLPQIKLSTQEMASLTSSLQKAGISGNQLKSIQNSIGGIGVATQKTVGNMNDFERAMNRALIVAPVWMALRSAFMFVGSAISENVKFLIELETAMARIKIVGKGTAEEYDSLKKSLVSLAVVYGVAASDATEAAVVFAQQGKSVSETIELTKTAMLGAQVIGSSVKETVENMTAAMNAFNIPAEQSITIINEWINVEKNFAVTAQDLAEATKKAGATANQMGISMSAFLGDVTAIVEVTRKSGSEAGNALNFIYARVHTTAKSALQDLANIPLYMDKFGNATKEAQPNLRATTDIIDELALKWNNLSEAERLEISTSLGSKRNLVSVSALMQNHTRSIEARVSALTSAMSAEKAFNIIQETTATKLKQLDSAWKALGVTFGDSDLFKTGINAMRGLIFLAESFVNKTEAIRHAMDETFESLDRQSKDKMASTKKFLEMLELQNKISKAPQTVENKNIKNQIDEAINDYTKNNPKLKLAVELGDKEKISEELKNIQKNAARQMAVTEVNRRYMPQIETVSRIGMGKQREALEKEYELAIQNAINFKFEDYLSLQKESEKLTLDEINAKGDEIESQMELTAKKEEQLKNDKILYEYGIAAGERKSEILKKEIELVKESQYQYSGANSEEKKNEEVEKLKLELLKAQNNEKEQDISNAIEILSLTGATSRQLLEAEMAMKAQVFGVTSVVNNEDIRLRLLKEQTKEMLNQVEISDDTVKLYKIAKESGVGTASLVGQFLTGGINFSQLKQSQSALEAFKKQFSQRYEGLQAAEYFGIPFRGSNMRGMGGYVPTAESEASRRITNIGRETATQQIQRNIDVNGLSINVTVNKEDTSGATKEDLSKAIFTKISESKEFNSIVENILENY